MTRPDVTIGMPVYDGADSIVAALDSLSAQTFGNYRLVISDNASTDGTEGICRSYAAHDSRIQYVRNPVNLGAAANYNHLIDLCDSPYFKWMAHDDLIAPSFLDRCVQTLAAAPADVVVVFSRRRFITHDGRPTVPEPGSYFHGLDGGGRSYHDMSFAQLVRTHGGCFPTFVFGLIRADALRKTRRLGAYWAADLVLAAELRLQGRLWEIPEDLYIQRLHAPTPLWLSRQTKKGEAAWYDPANARRKAHPDWRLFVEHLRAIDHADLTPVRRWSRRLDMAGYIWSAGRRMVGSRLARMIPKFRRDNASVESDTAPGLTLQNPHRGSLPEHRERGQDQPPGLRASLVSRPGPQSEIHDPQSTMLSRSP